MSDMTLFAVGCAVMFIFLGGTYVVYLESFAARAPVRARVEKKP